jgi:hypothetical protein
VPRGHALTRGRRRRGRRNVVTWEGAHLVLPSTYRAARVHRSWRKEWKKRREVRPLYCYLSASTDSPRHVSTEKHAPPLNVNRLSNRAFISNHACTFSQSSSPQQQRNGDLLHCTGYRGWMWRSRRGKGHRKCSVKSQTKEIDIHILTIIFGYIA